jgi:hypothetical protein
MCVMHCGVILSDSRCFPNCVLQNPGVPCYVSNKSVRNFRRQQKFFLRIYNNVANYWSAPWSVLKLVSVLASQILPAMTFKKRVCRRVSSASHYRDRRVIVWHKSSVSLSNMAMWNEYIYIYIYIYIIFQTLWGSGCIFQAYTVSMTK